MKCRSFGGAVGALAIWSTAHAAVIVVPTDQATIQLAVDAANPGDVVRVLAGTYTGDVIISTPLIMFAPLGPVSTIIDGRVTIQAVNVTVQDFTITNPNDNFGVVVGSESVAADLALVSGNHIIDIGTGGDTGETQGVWVQNGDNVTIQNNIFDGIASGPSAGSAKAILVTQSIGPPISGAFILGNTITNVTATNGGAYGIQAAGPAPGLAIANNTVDGLTGLWAHGYSLDNDTPGAIIQRNGVTNVTGTATGFGVGINLEGNSEVASILITENNFELLPGTSNVGILNQMTAIIAVAKDNWWGDATGPIDPTGTIEVDGTNCGPTMTNMNADGMGTGQPDMDFNAALGFVDYCPWSPVPLDLSVNPFAPNVPASRPWALLTLAVALVCVAVPILLRRRLG